jgi:hypothetical protein
MALAVVVGLNRALDKACEITVGLIIFVCSSCTYNFEYQLVVY